MKKVLSFTLAFLLVMLSTLPASSAYACSYGSCGGTTKSPERITLGSYTLSVSQTKSLADNMKKLTGPGSMITNTAASSLAGKIMGYAGKSLGAYITITSLAASLSANAVVSNDVIYAGSHGKRIKISITDYKYYHTSYSTQVIYSVVN